VGGVALLASGATVAAVGFSTTLLLVLGVGLVLVALLVVGYLLFVRARTRAGAKAADKSLIGMLRGRPRAVKDPQLIARLDQMADRFERGVEDYRKATGQPVSSSPWYLLVGEPGSGKTEAIRRCGVEFPEGLHEEQQGAGGTTNMDWWFTDQAIILDTAGRFAIDPEKQSAAPTDDEEAEKQSDARRATEEEWKEFLRLIATTRKHCPVNGLLLVIPATSLLRDSDELIQRKGRDLARFLDNIRRTLEVRFPVFVLITKADLIPGFREFFTHIHDVDLTQQMFGWSKPGGLDEPFEPEEIDKYLNEVRARLERRRLALITDPVHSRVPGGRRVEEVDALFTFPQRFAQLAPRLRSYLRLVFVKSKFNQAPLFLRGIYFTSSLEQGAEIDEVIARQLGVTLKQLAESGAGYRKERPLFLKDLFMKKVFEESRLVTREVYTDRIKVRRRRWLYGSVAVTSLLLLGFVVLGWWSLGKQIGELTRPWKALRDTVASGTVSADQFDVVAFNEGKIEYRLDKPLANGSLKDFLLARASARSTLSSGVYWLPRQFGDPVEASNSVYQELVLKRNIVDSVVRTSAQALGSASDKPGDRADWTKDGVVIQALAELARLDASPEPVAVNLAPLAKLLDRQAGVTSSDPQSLALFVADLEAGLQTSQLTLPVPTKADLSADLAKAVDQVAQYWTSQHIAPTSSPALQKVNTLASAMEGYRSAIEQVEALVPKSPDASLASYVDRRSKLADAFKVMRDRSDALTAARRDLGTWPDGSSIVETLRRQLAESRKAAEDALASVGGGESLRAAVSAAVGRLARAEADATAPLEAQARVEAFLLIDDPKLESQTHAQMTDGLLAIEQQALPSIDAGEASMNLLDEQIRTLAMLDVPGKPDGLIERVRRVRADLAANVSAPALRHIAIQRWLDSVPNSAAGLKERVDELSDADSQANDFDVLLVPMFHRSMQDQTVEPQAEPGFNPSRLAAILFDRAAISKVFGQKQPVLDADELQAQFVQRQDAIDAYLTDYAAYWADLTFEIVDWPDYASFVKDVVAAPVETIDDSLGRSIEQRVKAIETVVPFASKSDALVEKIQTLSALALPTRGQPLRERLAAMRLWNQFFKADALEARQALAENLTRFERNAVNPLILQKAEYHLNLLKSGLASLEQPARQAARAKLSAAIGDVGGFPGRLDATDVVSRDVLRDKLTMLAELSTLAEAQPPTASVADTTLAEALDGLLANPIDASQSARLLATRRWIESVVNGPIASIGFDPAHSGDFVRAGGGQVRIVLGGNELFYEHIGVTPGAEALKRLVEIRPSQASVIVEVRTPRDATVPAAATWTGPAGWGVLGLLHPQFNPQHLPEESSPDSQKFVIDLPGRIGNQAGPLRLVVEFKGLAAPVK
jgi:DNA polymerase III delta prime subunit